MNNKCEWENGTHKRCEGLRKWIWEGFSYDKKLKIFPYCPFCGADIRKPEPEGPLIVKSGNTWVCRYKGTNYLYIDLKHIGDDPPLFLNKYDTIIWGWIDFANVTIDDSIALLRPMAWFADRDDEAKRIDKLTYVGKQGDILKYQSVIDNWRNCYKLATPQELKELK